MRLLHTTQSGLNSFDILEFADNNIPPYAILSHTWESEEVTLQDMQSGGAERKLGFQKVQECCFVAKASGFDYAWIDTCCIDKTNSVELSEAINSMYRWYYEADVCYVYLADIQSESEFASSRWFTRGWTLQELIAPTNMIFFDGRWRKIGTKESLHQALSECTGIPENILLGDDLETASVAQRMSWAAKRQTTRLEDRAYSLLGIFGINMPLIYGEGRRSFIRLQEEILKVIEDHSIFAWTSDDEEESHGGLLATSPAAFQKCANLVVHNPFLTFGNEPLIVSSKGVHLGFNFVGLNRAGLGLAILHCTERGKKESLIAIHLQDSSLTMQSFRRIHCERTELLDMTKFRAALCPVKRICVQQRRLAAHRSTGRLSRTGKYHLAAGTNCRFPGTTVHVSEYFVEEEFAELLSTTLEIKKDVADVRGELLSSAAKRDDLDLVWSLLSRSDIRADDEDTQKRTPLSYAAENGSEAIVKLLLFRADVDPDSKSRDLRTPLHFAARHGHLNIIKLLLETGRVTTNINDIHGITPLSCAVQSGQLSVVQFLLDKGALMPSTHSPDHTLLPWAARAGNEDVIELIINKLSSTDSMKIDRHQLLMWAVEMGYTSVVKILLKMGADCKLRDKDGHTPLTLAAFHGHEDVLRLVLMMDDNLEEEWWGMTLLSSAAGNGHRGVVQLLLHQGANLEATDKKFHITPLSWAVYGGHTDVVQLLLDHHANTKCGSKEGRTLLSWAADHRENPAAQLLIRHCQPDTPPSLPDKPRKKGLLSQMVRKMA